MRKLLMVVLALLGFTQVSSAQRRISSVSLGSGEGAIASGITGVVRFEKPDSSEYSEFALMQEQAWFVMGKNVHGRISGFVAASVGHYQGSPWVGPYVVLGTTLARINGRDLRIGTFQWPAFYPYEPRSFKEDGVKNPENVLVGYLGDLNLSYGPVTVAYAKLNFLDQPWNDLPSIAVTTPLLEDITVSSSWTRNTNAKRNMWYMGLNWTPKKK